MSKKNILVFVLLLAAFAVSFLALTLDMFSAEPPPRIYNISMIVRGKSSDRWESIRQGADQAAGEMNVDLRFVTLSDEDDAEEQMEVLRREYENGVDAVLLSAADSLRLVKPVEEIAAHVPVVCIESPVASASVASYIAADNYDMGVRLAQQVVFSGNSRRNIAVVLNTSVHNAAVQERYDGLMSVFSALGVTPEVWDLPGEPVADAERMAGLLSGGGTDVLVALDLPVLELTAQAASDASAAAAAAAQAAGRTFPEDYLEVFGVGSTGRIASFIEQEVILATVAQNDFAIGYLGVKAAVDTLEKRPVEKSVTVEHRAINRENMYELDNQRLLFPFIR